MLSSILKFEYPCSLHRTHTVKQKCEANNLVVDTPKDTSSVTAEGRTKICTKCKQEHPITFYYRRAQSKDGFNSWCKDCMDEATNESWRRWLAKQRIDRRSR